MKKSFLAAMLAALLALSACGGPAAAAPGDGGTLQILAATYPVYLFAAAVTEGVEGVEVKQLVNQQTACLHDYTLTVNDMKAIENADVILINGAGLENFMSDALAASTAAVVDCSAGVDLLPAMGHEGHDHETEYDPHIWMDPARAGVMVRNVAEGLSAADPDNADAYRDNAAQAAALLEAKLLAMRELLTEGPDGGSLKTRELITFHDGFGYFADALGLHILKAIEEEEGSETSAQEIKEIVDLIGECHIPAIFTEVNGSDATAKAIQRETGVGVGQLSMIMSGSGTGLSDYLDAYVENVRTIIILLGKEGAKLP